ncbi:hypothetical protein [Oscillibacter ruminantium]|uniref:hypothetical protein n=1 Tax=Oscillibacter ruminantium TaxID=1263547 RepID=UPI00331EF51C
MKVLTAGLIGTGVFFLGAFVSSNMSGLSFGSPSLGVVSGAILYTSAVISICTYIICQYHKNK